MKTNPVVVYLNPEAKERLIQVAKRLHISQSGLLQLGLDELLQRIEGEGLPVKGLLEPEQGLKGGRNSIVSQ